MEGTPRTVRRVRTGSHHPCDAPDVRGTGGTLHRDYDVCVLSLSAIADDARVRRQAETLVDAGMRVTAIGLAGARGHRPEWQRVELAAEPMPLSSRLVHGAAMIVAGSTRLGAAVAYWVVPRYRQLFAAARECRARLYLANDWETLPIARRAARLHRGAYAFDSHELAVLEAQSRPRFPRAYARWIRRLERSAIHDADFVMTVGDALADQLMRSYQLDVKPTVVRNVPAYAPVATNVVNDPLVVLYHGALAADRRLDVLVDTAARCSDRFRFVIRGSGSASYENELANLIAERRVQDRVRIEPPVPIEQVVAAAASADIGVVAMPTSNVQAAVALPNKLFDYIMAGLAIVGTDLPELRRVIGGHDVGITVPDFEPGALADALQLLTPERVAHYKRRAAVAAKHLAWEAESRALVSVVARTIEEGRS